MPITSIAPRTGQDPTQNRREDLVNSSQAVLVTTFDTPPPGMVERVASKTLSDLVTWHPTVIAADHPKARMVISALVPPMAIVFEGLDRLKQAGKWIRTSLRSPIK